MHAFIQFIGRVPGALLRVVLLLAGLVLAASLLVAGAVLGTALVVTSLLRGKRPTLRRQFRWQGPMGRGPFGPGRQAGTSAQSARPVEVIDIDAREVPSSPRAAPLDPSNDAQR